MTYVLVFLAVVAAGMTWAAATGAFPVTFADPVAEQTVNRAKARGRVTREVLAVMSGTRRGHGGSEPLFPDVAPGEDGEEFFDELPAWLPTESVTADESTYTEADGPVE
ncbi:MAG: hypothetical protein LBK72_03410 [Bifidobacteriaceae bacterium]|jgi:hypothetical protein|nr:hypothetical protein [Bifidobacteriaceae bacterium]